MPHRRFGEGQHGACREASVAHVVPATHEEDGSRQVDRPRSEPEVLRVFARRAEPRAAHGVDRYVFDATFPEVLRQHLGPVLFEADRAVGDHAQWTPDGESRQCESEVVGKALEALLGEVIPVVAQREVGPRQVYGRRTRTFEDCVESREALVLPRPHVGAEVQDRHRRWLLSNWSEAWYNAF